MPLVINPHITFICQSCRRALKTNTAITRPFSRSSTPSKNLEAPTFKNVISYRKQLKEETKRQKRNSSLSKSPSKLTGGLLDKWVTTIGLEIHAQLNTAKKLFSSAATSANESTNTHVAPFDVALPGTQPQFQRETLIPALRAALALNCIILCKSTFDRKHYFYQDQPAGYQITQYYEPFAKTGSVTLFYPQDGIVESDAPSVTIPIKQIQIEQDTGKTLHQPPYMHILDFNRVSHPLVEIITEPVIHHPSTAVACVRKIQNLLEAVDACTLGMEMGGLRVDVNVSVALRAQEQGQKDLGQRTEIKNLNSFKAVEAAIIAERDRQIQILEDGGRIEGETRGWTLGATQTTRLRGKEGEIDYRYMPDPDLPPLVIGKNLLDHLRATSPQLPDEMALDKLANSPYDLSVADAMVLITTDDGDRLEYYLELVTQLCGSLQSEEFRLAKAGKIAGNWVLHELGSLIAKSESSWDDQRIREEQLTSILVRLIRRQITGQTAKKILAMLFDGDHRPVEQIIESENLLLHPMTQDEYRTLAHRLVTENEKMVRAIKEKNQRGKIKWFVGQMIQQGEEGRVEADRAEKALEDLMQI